MLTKQPHRLAVYAVLSMVTDGLALAGPDCRSWGLPCRFTSGRSIMNILGSQQFEFVAVANVMISRFLISLDAVIAHLQLHRICKFHFLHAE